MRALLQKRLARGRVELQISVQLRDTRGADRRAERGVRQRAVGRDRPGARAGPRVGHADARAICCACRRRSRVRERTAEADPAAEAQLAASVEAAVEQALADLDAMRVREGGHLRDRSRRPASSRWRRSSTRSRRRPMRARTSLEARLQERVREISLELPVDQAMIAQEIVRDRRSARTSARR